MSGLHGRSAAERVEDDLFMAGVYMGARCLRQAPRVRLMILLRLQAQDIGDDFVLLLRRDSAMLGICLWGVAKKGVQAGLRRRRILGDGIPAWGRIRRRFRLSLCRKWHSERHLRPRSRPAETTVRSPCAQATGAQAITVPSYVGRRRLRIDAPPCAVGVPAASVTQDVGE